MIIVLLQFQATVELDSDWRHLCRVRLLGRNIYVSYIYLIICGDWQEGVTHELLGIEGRPGPGS